MMLLIILHLVLNFLSICYAADNSHNTYYLAYNTLNFTEIIHLDNIITLNQLLKNQAESLRHPNISNFFQDTLYLQIIKDHKIITQKSLNLGIKAKTLKKRSTIINLGLFSEYLGLASTDTTNELANRITTLENEIDNHNSNTAQILTNFAKQLLIIERWTEIERKNQLNSAKTTFLYLKLSHISSHLKDIITDLEIAKIAWTLNLPSNIIFDLNILTKKVDNIRSELEFPLFQSKNFTLLSKIKNSISFKINDNILYQSVSIPMIKMTDICTSNNGKLDCIGYTTTLNISDCTLLEHKKFICFQRPCMVFENAKIKCTRITDNSFILESDNQPCTILEKPNRQKNLLLNNKQVIYLDKTAKLTCNKVSIPESNYTFENSSNHFLFNLTEDSLSKLNLTLPADHKLINDLKTFHTLNIDNNKILNKNECNNTHLTYVTLSNTLVTGILLTGLAIGIVIYYCKERNKARVE